MQLGILGSGFGLYGHMPAFLMNYPGEVLLPRRYQEKFLSRMELRDFEARIKWCTDDTDVLAECECLVIAQIPQTQEVLIQKALQQENISYVLLEKPLARSPEISAELLHQLIQSGKTFRIMYSFLYLDWFKKLRSALKDKTNYLVELNWKFNAHHFINDLPVWKRSHSQGGGVVRFYGVHLIAMASALHFKEVVFSETQSSIPDEPYVWSALFTEKSGNRLNIQINSRSDKKEFSVQVKNDSTSVFYIDEADPFFEYTGKDGLDNRIDLNKEILASLLIQDDHLYDNQFYKEVNTLWQRVETATL